jgi:hypothetical protein
MQKLGPCDGVSLDEERVNIGFDPHGQIAEHIGKLGCIGFKALHPRLGTAELGRRNHIHGPGNLPCFLDSAYLPQDIS